MSFRIIDSKKEARRALEAGAVLQDEDGFAWQILDGRLVHSSAQTSPLESDFGHHHWGSETCGPFRVLREPCVPVAVVDNSLTAWCERSHALADAKGFNDGVTVNYAELSSRLLLTVGELTEAQEALRENTDPTHRYLGPDGKPEGFGPELADAFLRLAHLARWSGVDLQYEVNEKHKYNQSRERLHGKKF